MFKFYALGFKQYWYSKFNAFDAVVVFLSILELVLVEGFNYQPIGLSVLRYGVDGVQPF